MLASGGGEAYPTAWALALSLLGLAKSDSGPGISWVCDLCLSRIISEGINTYLIGAL